VLKLIYQQWSGLFVPLMLVALACAPVEILAHKERHPIASRIRGAGYMAIFVFGLTVSLIGAQWLIRYLGIKPLFRIDLTSLSGGGLALLMTVVPYFIFDGCYYWFHRLQHCVPLLWRFHSVHHAIEELNATNCYHHWTEGFLRVSLVILPLSLLIQLRLPEIPALATEVAALTFILNSWAMFVHSSAVISLGPFERVFVSPQFHRVHHSLDDYHHNRNFAGLFPIFDMIFGTACFPKPDETINIGLPDKHESITLWQYLFTLNRK